MPRTPPLALSAGLAVLAVLLLMATFTDAPPAPLPAESATQRSAEETQELLHGTWMREYTDRDVRIRRLLRLGGDGVFSERVHAVDSHGKVTEMAHEGHWFYDGINLKRKYTLVDGEPPSRLRNLPFATFEISFPTRDEFMGVDHVRKNRITYRRVASESMP